MRKPRDYDAELKALDDKARQLKARKREQLGELVIAIGADALTVEQLAGALLLAVEAADANVKEAQRTRGAAFFHAKPAHAKAFAVMTAAMRRTSVIRARLQLHRARHDTREWQVKRRERTRQLIELGGLIAKAGLIKLTDDDRALIYGALIDVASRLRGEDSDRYRLIWTRRGRRAFADDASAG